MTLTPGTRLGPYEIESRIGVGGQGEVYQAKDTRLDRTVAIKVLPEHLAESPERKARFEREAKAISQLNHPHICTLYDVGEQDGVDYLVMEYIEGETLAERLKKGALKLDQALAYAVQIADGLDRAHRAGIVHRDLKPGNVMLTKSGVKLLDFGLARLVGGHEHLSSSDASTRQKELTAEEAIVGTLQYMAPEQLERKPADARTDLFAFGALLYEMITGKKAFEGESQASVIAKILEHDVLPVSELQPRAPGALNRCVERCLAKDAEDRWQTARDLMAELKWILENDSEVVTSRTPSNSKRERWIWGAALVLAVGLTALLVPARRPSPGNDPSRDRTRFTETLPPDQVLSPGRYSLLELSPDGKRIVYAASSDGRSRLYVRELDQFEPRPIPGTEGAIDAFFSDDGEWLGFIARGKLHKVDLAGGAPVAICDTLISVARSGATWTDDIIIFAGGALGLSRVSTEDGVAEVLTTPDPQKGETAHLFPHLLPDGQSLLFTVLKQEGPEVALLSLESGEWRTVIPGASKARYLANGLLVYASAGKLAAVHFDLERQEPRGRAVPIPEEANVPPGTDLSAHAVSPSGTLAFVRPNVSAPAENTLVWVDRGGSATPIRVDRLHYTVPRLSPDDRWVALGIGTDIWVVDTARRGTATRLTFEGSNNRIPVWTPDGKRIAFASDRGGVMNLYWKSWEGSGSTESLLTSERVQLPLSWSPDGQALAFYALSPSTGRDTWVLPMGQEPSPFVATPFTELAPMFSTDGRWIAYVSNESGQYEVYIQRYPDLGGKQRISIDGGTEPVWSRNGKELFYRNGNRMMAVPVEMGPVLSVGTPAMLFEAQYENDPIGNPNYDVMRDGQRFVMIQGRAGPNRISVVVNWKDELERLVSADN